jgi:hypothetical protein
MRPKQNPAKFDRCVKDVKRSKSARSAYAICTAAGTRNPGTGAMVATALSHSAAGRKAQVAIKKLFSKAKNPQDASEQMFEIFHGMAPNEILHIVERVHVHANLWTAGTLTSMVIQTEYGYQFDLNAPDPDTAKPKDVVYVTFNEAGNQIYFRGGNQEIPRSWLEKAGLKSDDFREHMIIGAVVELTYRTKKKFEKGGKELVDFYHGLGKEHSRGVLPMLVYKPRDPSMALYGGRYKVLPKRADLGASPGIGG